MRSDFFTRVRRSIVTVGLVLAGIFLTAVPDASASFIYTFSDTDAVPFSFSFEVPSLITVDEDPLAVTPIVTSDGQTITDAGVAFDGSSFVCFAFAASGTSINLSGECAVDVTSGPLNFTRVTFTGATVVGTFGIFQETTFGFLIGIDQLVISESTTAPEPASLLLLATGGVGYVISRRRRQPAKH